MKRNYLYLLLLVAVSAVFWSFKSNIHKEGDEKDMFVMRLINYVVTNAHYSPKDLDDSVSEKIYENYLDVLDPSRRFFVEEDIVKMDFYKQKIDDQIQQTNVSFFNLSYELIQKRMKEAKDIYVKILEKPFDFTQKEEIDTEYEKQPFAKNKTELEHRWYKQLKLAVLSNIEDKEKIQEGKQEESIEEPNTPVKIETKKKKEPKKEEKKNFEELEKEAREQIKKNLDDYMESIFELTKEEWFAMYLNAILEQIDPHTTYLSPEMKKRFDDSMSGSMEGIGATLSKKGDYIQIVEIVAGGPAWRQGDLENEDIIMKVAQGKEQPVDIAGMRLNKVIKLIKGKKGTEVRLTVKKVDGTIKVITIVRDKFEIEETFAKSVVVDTEDGRFGLIQLPKFYIDFETRTNRNAYTDVKKEVEYLKQQNVKGIIIDLRNNGGGSLETVVNMVGLFIDKGPVVQVRDRDDKKNILSDKMPGVEWDGALVVLQNSYSASASEIFAAAIQDYNRGLVLGSKHSFGKGTVQNMLELGQLIRSNEDFGSIKLTFQKFYRINGGSTQLKGVESDIVLPDRFSHIDSGERDYKTAMPWDRIQKLNYKVFDNNFADAIQKSKQRVEKNQYFKLVEENAKWISKRKDDHIFSLNYDDYKKEREQIEKETKKFKALKDYKNNLNFKSLPHEEKLFANDSILKKKRERWHKNLSNDLYVEEAVNVLKDISL